MGSVLASFIYIYICIWVFGPAEKHRIETKLKFILLGEPTVWCGLFFRTQDDPLFFFSSFFYGVCILYKIISLVPHDELPFCSSCRGPSAQRDTDEQNDILWPAMACNLAHKAKEMLCWLEPKALNYYPFGEDGTRVRCSFRETGCLSFICIVRFQFWPMIMGLQT